MATMHKSKAIKNINKGKTSTFYSYVEELNKSNPVLVQFEKELNEYMVFVKKKNSGALKTNEHPKWKTTDSLFDIWTKFEPKIPQKLYFEKLIKTGEFLTQQKEYFTAIWQCYNRYLSFLSSNDLFSVQKSNDFKQRYFSSDSLLDPIDTYRALYGYIMGLYQMTVLSDPKLQNELSVSKLSEILRLLRLLMTLQLEKDELCWLVYNSSIYIYTIGRYMMQLGYSKIILEYLLFCSLAMESSIPLLGIKYLSWRSIIYSVVCQCYYDCKYNEEAENFARRALSKVNELYELELASVNGNNGARQPEFREATIKMGCYLFKNLVFENRRKSTKSRKNKIVYKEIIGQPWPRTPVEKLLNEMFDSPAGQFLAIEEALFDSNRRIAISQQIRGENEKEEAENQDVVLELFYAAEYLASGGKHTKKGSYDLDCILFSDMSQISMAIKGENGVQAKNFFKIVKLAYNYEVMGIFRRFSFKVMAMVEVISEMPSKFISDVQTIQLLILIDRFTAQYWRKLKGKEKTKNTIATNAKTDAKSKTFQKNENKNEALSDVNESVHSQETEPVKDEDYLTNIAYKILDIMESGLPPAQTDRDVIFDTILFLWKRCRDVFQKVQTGSEENFRWVLKLDNFPKWLFILNLIHESMCHFGFQSADISLFIHCSLRLGLVYESLGTCSAKKLTKTVESKATFYTDDNFSNVRLTKFTVYENKDAFNERYSAAPDARGNFLKARNILKKSLQAVRGARALMTVPNRDLYDVDYEYFEDSSDSEDESLSASYSRGVIDLHTELLYVYQRLNLKFAITPDSSKEVAFEKEFDIVLKECKKNKIAQSLLFLCRSLYLNQLEAKNATEIRNSVYKAYERLLDSEEEENISKENHKNNNVDEIISAKVPPPPVIISKTNTSVTFRTRNFQTLDGTKPCWYRAFAVQMSKVNVKVRIVDNTFPGCGEQIPAIETDPITISGLSQDEKYIFAVAAYDHEGELIGNSIGQSSEPVLTSNIYSSLMCWTFLCQAAYQANVFDISLIAFERIWMHFVNDPVEDEGETKILSNESDFKIKFYQLEYTIILKTSQLLLRKLIDCIFIVSQIKTKEKNLHCDNLFDGYSDYDSQFDRLKECEKLLIAIELGVWLNDYPIILQSIVMTYGFLTPLIYYNTAYEPITKILTHCLLVFEEIPQTFFSRKSKALQENLHHMLACISFYIIDALKRLNKKTLAHIFNVICRRLLGEETASIENIKVDEIFNENESNVSTTTKKNEKSTKNTKSLEFKALDSFLTRGNFTSKTININFTGNEDTSVIFAYIQQNSAKLIYKDIVMFRKRSNYFDILLKFLQKALDEELVKDVNEWCYDTFLWHQNRTASILGPRQARQKPLKTDFDMKSSLNLTEDSIEGEVAVEAKTKYVSKTRPRPKIKKYRYIVPQDMDPVAKAELEAKQKVAIDSIYYCFPIKHDNWKRRIKLRKVFQEEASLRANYYALWALSNFSMLMNRIYQTTPQNRMNFVHKLNSSSYLDPQQFLFDQSGSLILTKEDSEFPRESKPKKSITDCGSILINVKRVIDPHPTKKSKKRLSKDTEDKLHELKDTSELIADSFTKLVEPISEATVSETSNKKTLNPILFTEFTEMTKRVFSMFRNSIVIAHRYKKWTDLQNNCKLMYNCINSLLIALPAISHNNRKVFNINDAWDLIAPVLYIAAENLLDMLFFNTPMNQTNRWFDLLSSNKWFDKNLINKGGASLKHDIALDDITSIDLRFLKDFVFRTIQALISMNKYEKLLNVALKFNVMTSFKYAELLSPIIINSKHQLMKALVHYGSVSQPHFDKIKSQLGKYPNMNDILIRNLIFEISPVKDLSNSENINRSLQLVTVPIDFKESARTLNEAMNGSLYVYRSVLHSRRLLSMYLFSQTNHHEFFGIIGDGDNGSYRSNEDGSLINTDRLGFDQKSYNKLNQSVNDFFHVNPIDFKSKTFESCKDLYLNDIQIKLESVIESYQKSIKQLLHAKEKDLSVQMMHELGNIYHFIKDTSMAYRHWNEALDTLIGLKNSLIQWRKEFWIRETKSIDAKKLLQTCGVWGCLLGGILTSKMAQYYLVNDLELQIESCLFSTVLFKAIFCTSITHSKFDLDFAAQEVDHLNSEFLIPGLIFNSDTHRFDIRYIISAMNFVCLELLSSGHYLNMLPTVSLYEYFARSIARDLMHTVLARLIKIEALIKLNLFKEAIQQLNQLNRGERLPHSIDENYKKFSDESVQYIEIDWDSSKPIFELNNLRCLEAMLSFRLPKNLAKVYPPQLSCRLYLVLCKLYVQIALSLPCLPNLDRFYGHELYSFIKNNTLTQEAQIPKPIFTMNNQRINQDSNPDVVKVFTNLEEPLTLEFIKGCLLGAAKTHLTKSLSLFASNFPEVDRYCVSQSWEKEFKFESNLLLANVADQCQLGYIALQTITDAMRELAVEEKQNIAKFVEPVVSKHKPKKVPVEKKSKYSKKAVYGLFDMISKSHLNSRKWLKARYMFIQFMFNQLEDPEKPKGTDETITSNFGDLKYYCEKCLNETNQFYDNEVKACIYFIMVSIDLIRGVITLQECQENLKLSLENFVSCRQLSTEGFINYLKAQILAIDINFSFNLVNLNEKNKQELNLENIIESALSQLINIEEEMLSNLRVYGGETIECFINKSKAFFNTIVPEIKNIYNPLLYYVCHTKQRLGACLMLKSSMEENDAALKHQSSQTCMHALNVLCIGIELNKVMMERSISLEIELNYKQAYCLKELFMKHKMCSLNDVVDAYNNTINLTHNSTHDLTIIRDSYMELAIVFISIFEPTITYVNAPKEFKTFQTNFNWSQLSTTESKMKTVQATKSIEAALTAFNYIIKCSQTMKSKKLLPGHQSIKEISPMKSVNSLLFVANDLLGDYVLADRERIFRDEIEKEVITLMPEFEATKTFRSFEEKVEMLKQESNETITWRNLLNYKEKLEHMYSMKNLNLLKHGRNRFKFADLYTIGYTPILKSSHYISSKLFELNQHLKTNFEPYKTECQAPILDLKYFKDIAQMVSKNKDLELQTLRHLKANVKTYTGNKATTLNNHMFENNTQFDWSYLQQFPSNYNHLTADLTNEEKSSMDLSKGSLITFNWYKSLVVSEDDLVNNKAKMTGIITYKHSDIENKLRFKILESDLVLEIYEKLSPIAAISDTMLNKTYTKNKLDAEYQEKVIEVLTLIGKLFGKKTNLVKDEWPFELIPSNFEDLENMFNTKFGGQTNNESLKNYITNLFL